MRKLLSITIVSAVMCVAFSACGGGGGGTDAACGKALDSYNAALVASDTDGSGSNLSNAQEMSHQADVVKNCSEDQFVAFIKGDGYDYTKGPDAIAIGDPRQVYEAFKSNG